MEGFLCPDCNTSFGDQESLIVHFEHTHATNSTAQEETFPNELEESKKISINGLSTTADVFRGWFSSGCKICSPTIDKIKEANKQSKNIKKSSQKNEQVMQKLNGEIAKWKQDIDKDHERIKNIDEKRQDVEKQNAMNLEDAVHNAKSLYEEIEVHKKELQKLLKIETEKKKKLSKIKFTLKNSDFDPVTLQKRVSSQNENESSNSYLYVSSKSYRMVQSMKDQIPELTDLKNEAINIKELLGSFQHLMIQNLTDLRVKIKKSKNEYISTSNKISKACTSMMHKYDSGMQKASLLAQDIANKESECNSLEEKNLKSLELLKVLRDEKNECEAILEEKARLIVDIGKFQKESKIKENSILKLKKELSDCVENNRNFVESHNQLIGSIETENKILSSDVESFKKQLESMNDKINSVNEKIQVQNKEYETTESRLKTELECLDSENHVLEEKYENLNSENEKVQNLLDKVETELLTNKKLLKDLETENLDLAERGVFLSNERENLEKSILYLKEQNEVHKKTNAESLSTLLALNGTNKELLFELDELKRTYWQTDKSAIFCFSCKTYFTITIRRHHCRKCGRIFCNACSPKRSLEKSPNLIRICDSCYDQAYKVKNLE